MQKKKVSAFTIVLFIFLALLLVASSALFSAYVYIRSEMRSVDVEGEGVSCHFEIPSGMSVRAISAALEEKGLIRDANVFYIVSRVGKFCYRYLGGKNDFALKSGSYNLNSSMDMLEIMSVLHTGKQEDIIVVIPEGLTLSKIASIVASHDVCSEEGFITSAKDKSIIEDYGFDAESLEGCLFPDTYFFVRDMESEKVVRMMVDNFFAHVGEIGELKDVERKDLYQKVILASIVEREYRVAEEAPMIASVFYNRLQKNMRLQSCATIEYIITEIEGLPHPDVIHYKDLYRESPYNTYREKGLPPSPIANPGFVALKAVAKPADTNYYYFRLTDEQKGSHTFSETFDEHTTVNIAYKTKAANK